MKKFKLTAERRKRMDKFCIEQHNEMLTALEILLSSYEANIKIPLCPLCGALNTPVELHCNACAWKIITGEICHSYAGNLYDNSDIEYFMTGQPANEGWQNWIKLRIPQLKNWIEIYNTYLIEIIKQEEK